MKSKLRSQWREILGDPNGVEIGTPNDTRYATDTDTLWMKAHSSGEPFGWVPISGAAVTIDSITTEGGEPLSILTGEGQAPFSALQIGTYSEQFVTVPAATTIVLTPIMTLEQDGRNAIIDLKTISVDRLLDADVATFVQINGWRRAAGVTSPIAATLFDKQRIGGNGSFAEHVTVFAGIAVAMPNVINLLATNSFGAPRTGHITANWMIQQGGALVE